MDYTTLIVTGAGLLILITFLVGIRLRRKILQTDKFKADVRQAFIANPEEAYDTYMPSERQVGNWINLYQNLAGMANTSAMITNQTFAAGGEGFLASVGRFQAATQSSRIRKRLLALHLLLNQCARVSVVAQQHASEALDDELIDAIGELAYLEARAMAIGAIPEFMKVLH
jgi:hypothetical protein